MLFLVYLHSLNILFQAWDNLLLPVGVSHWFPSSVRFDEHAILIGDRVFKTHDRTIFDHFILLELLLPSLSNHFEFFIANLFVFCEGDSRARASGFNNRAIRPAAKVTIMLRPTNSC